MSLGSGDFIALSYKRSGMEIKMENTEAMAAVTAEATTAVKAEATTEAATEVILQYRNYEVNMDDVTERVKSHYIAKGYKADSIEDMQIYVKPEDFTAYYVINDGVVGKVNLF